MPSTGPSARGCQEATADVDGSGPGAPAIGGDSHGDGMTTRTGSGVGGPPACARAHDAALSPQREISAISRPRRVRGRLRARLPTRGVAIDASGFLGTCNMVSIRDGTT